MITSIGRRTRNSVRLFAGHESSQKEGYLELGRVDWNFANGQNAASNRNVHEKVLGRGFQNDRLRASDLGVRYDGVDDKTRTGGYVFCNVWLVDWCTMKCEERRLERGRGCELTPRRNDWGSFLVVFITPMQKHQRGKKRHTIYDAYLPFLLPER